MQVRTRSDLSSSFRSITLTGVKVFMLRLQTLCFDHSIRFHVIIVVTIFIQCVLQNLTGFMFLANDFHLREGYTVKFFFQGIS